MSKEEKNTYTIKLDENLGEVKIADEVVAIIAGLAKEFCYYGLHKVALKNKIDAMYEQDEYCKAIKRGTRPVSRMKQLIAFGRKYFSDHEN